MRSILFLTLTGLLAGCGDRNDPTTPPVGVLVHDPPVVLATLHSGLSTELRAVISSQSQWQAFWQQLIAAGAEVQPLPPAVDFTADALVVAALGQRERAGFHIQIPSYRRFPTDLEVTVLKTSPSPACPTAPVITTPLVIARVSPAVPARFVEVDHQGPCGVL